MQNLHLYQNTHFHAACFLVQAVLCPCLASLLTELNQRTENMSRLFLMLYGRISSFAFYGIRIHLCGRLSCYKRETIAHLKAIIKFCRLFRCSRAANSTVSGPIWLKFELIQNTMYVLITCKFKKYQINSKREKMEPSFFRHTRAATLLF